MVYVQIAVTTRTTQIVGAENANDKEKEMILKVTTDEMKKMAVLAINASSPMGMGFLHFKNKEYTMADLENYLKDTGIFGGNAVGKNPKNGVTEIQLDYVEGRMCKFHAKKDSDTAWEVWPDQLQYDYQSWKGVYPTWEKLKEAATKK